MHNAFVSYSIAIAGRVAVTGAYLRDDVGTFFVLRPLRVLGTSPALGISNRTVHGHGQ